MTLRLDAADLVAAIEVATLVGTIVAMLVIGLLVYLMVRPSRRRRDVPASEAAGLDTEMLRLMERMEHRLEILERAVAGRTAGEDRIVQTGVEAPETRRRK